MPATTHFSSRCLPWLLAAATFAVLAWLNLTPGERGNSLFEEHHFHEFDRSRGWPLGSWTMGNNDAIALVDGSVVQGDTYYVRDISPGSGYPHFFVNLVFLALDTLVALCLVGIAFIIGRLIGRRVRRSGAAPGPRPARS